MSAIHVGNFTELRPTVNFAGCTLAESGHQWGPRIIPDYQIIYLLAGTAELRLGTRSCELRPGDMGLYGGGTPMILRNPGAEPFNYYSIHFDWDQPDAQPLHPSARMIYCSDTEMAQEPAALHIGFGACADLAIPFRHRAPQMEEALRLLVEEYQQQQVGYELVLRGRMIVLLADLMRYLSEEQEPVSRRKIRPALQLLEQHPGQTWSVADLARACGYQTAYFTELFKMATGATPKAYMIEQRLRRAKQLLLSGEPIDAIAEQLGYGSAHYFYRTFKEAIGMTPSEFRMQGE
ncbi:hypothetical protein B1748_05205 [Paenibacillus sp. MY03]|jgi:AraC-like DNA-binding protein|uniref:AraC family transcriptional regulator n=1 Tax=Paenibacillus sp. MY03 TaxID=302980 RepID=UPI000B3C006E|nr:AraC family transcriptional regulator [Paenibacillus sp. MY03]OUS78157.1 hypothetical protein B1748_05205 [Paenibacillus sp. MY03]